jgi:two-component system sensor histidine kinase ChiS
MNNSHNKRRIGLTILIMFLIVGINFLSMVNWKKLPEARNGVLDLSQWEGIGQDIISLKGEWIFYPNQLLYRTEEADASTSSVSLYAPGNQLFEKSASMNGHPLGYGTYRLQVKLGQNKPELLAFRVQLIRSAHALIVNNVEIGRNGLVAKDDDHYSAEIKPYIAFSRAESSSLDILLQVSNFEHALSGGMIQSIRMGPSDPIIAEQQRASAFEFGLIVLCVIHALYFGVLHRIAPRNGWLYLSLFFICSALLYSVQGTRWLLSVWPHLSYKIVVDSYWLSSIGLLVSVFMFLYVRHKQHISKLIKWVFLVISFSTAVFVVIVPLSVSTHVLAMWIIVPFIVHIYFLIILLQRIRSGYDQIRYDFWAFCLYSGHALLNIFLQFGVGETNLWYFIQAVGFNGAISVLFLMQFYQAYKKNKELTLELQRVNQLKSEFMASMSKQMITPVNAIISVSEARIHSRESLTVEQLQDLRLITSVGWTMRWLVDDLLDFSRIREEGLRLQIRAIHLSSVMTDIMDRIRYLIYSDRVILDNRIPSDLPPILADEQRLQQILSSLLQTTTKLLQDGLIVTEAYVDGEMIVIEIIMTGVGISASKKEKLSRMLQPIYDVEGRVMMGDEGMGLQLVHSLVALHKGSITVVGDSEHKIMVRMVFPFTLQQQMKLPPLDADDMRIDQLQVSNLPIHSHEELARRSELRILNRDKETELAQILIVTDDSFHLNVLTRILSMERYSVTIVGEVNDQQHFMKQLRHADLVIVDRTLQDMSGLDVCRRIREHYSLFELPILLLISTGFSDTTISASQAGANDFIEKPVEASELRVRVRTLIQLKRSVGARIKMELAFLQAQIKPHFLFNTLNAIAALSKREPEKMTELLTEFGQYLRESFRFDNTESLVSLERELTLVKSYLYIEKVRFQDWLTYDIELLTSEHVRIPPLTIQPLVENAVRHGIMGRADGGHIHIKIYKEADELRIVVKDNGIGMSSELLSQIRHSPPSGGIGIRNIERRMKQLFGYGLSMISAPEQGTEIMIRLPMEKVGTI